MCAPATKRSKRMGASAGRPEGNYFMERLIETAAREMFGFLLEALRSGEELATYSKKMQSALSREYRKMFRNLNGIRTMARLPEALVVVDPKKEKNAVREARKMGITTVALIDSDSDPDEVDLPIPGNDDSIRSIELIVRLLADVAESLRAELGDRPVRSSAVSNASIGTTSIMVSPSRAAARPT